MREVALLLLRIKKSKSNTTSQCHQMSSNLVGGLLPPQEWWKRCIGEYNPKNHLHLQSDKTQIPATNIVVRQIW